MKNGVRSDSLFRAFADQTRLRLLALLAQRSELCVCDLRLALLLPQSKVSRHLGYLRKAGLVDTRRKKKWIFYALSKPTGHFHRGLVKGLKNCFDEVEMLKRDAKKLRRLSLRNPSCQ